MDAGEEAVDHIQVLAQLAMYQKRKMEGRRAASEQGWGTQADMGRRVQASERLT